LLLAVTPALRWLVLRLAVAVGQAPRVSCSSCNAALRPDGAGWTALTPVGRCGRCGTAVGPPAWLVEATFVVAVTAAVSVTAPPAVRLASLWWGACAVPLLFVDVRVHRLPDVLTGSAVAGVVVAFLAEAAVTGRWQHVVTASLSAAVFGMVFLLVALLLGRRGMGLGDVKLTVSIAALLGWWGWGAAFVGLFLGFLVAGLVGAVLLATRRMTRGEHIPLGPFFITGTWLALVLLAWAGPQ
jgi:leader peptidase (prepilin peptidase)/N-methyltransferase